MDVPLFCMLFVTLLYRYIIRCVMMKSFLTVAVLAAFLAHPVYECSGRTLFFQDKREKKEAEKEEMAAKVSEAVSAREYVITVDHAIPMQGRSVLLTYPYALEVRKDTVVSHLPFFGRAYSLPYGGGDGLNFTGTSMEYASGTGKRGSYDISFKVTTREDTFSFSLNIYPNGSAFLSVTSVNRQPISYNGYITFRDEEKE